MQLFALWWGRSPAPQAKALQPEQPVRDAGDSGTRRQAGRKGVCLSVLQQREAPATCATARDTKKQPRGLTEVSTPRLLRGQLPTWGLVSLRLSKRKVPALPAAGSPVSVGTWRGPHSRAVPLGRRTATMRQRRLCPPGPECSWRRKARSRRRHI